MKFHWKPKLGLQSVVWNEAVKINGADPDFHRRDLWNAIQAGDYPEWELGLQLFDEAFADRFDFDVSDATKIIPEELVPVRRVGRLVLNRCVDNFFAETEQVAFCTQNIVPGIDFSNDPLLQGRNFSYLDTQIKRLGGPKFHASPDQRAKMSLSAFSAGWAHGDGQSERGGLTTSRIRGTVPMAAPGSRPTAGFSRIPPAKRERKGRYRSETFADHYSQARQFYISQTHTEQDHLARALVFELSKCERPDIRGRMVAHLRNIDEDLAQKVAAGLALKELPDSAEAARPTEKRFEEVACLEHSPEWTGYVQRSESWCAPDRWRRL